MATGKRNIFGLDSNMGAYGSLFSNLLFQIMSQQKSKLNFNAQKQSICNQSSNRMGLQMGKWARCSTWREKNK